MYLTFLLMFSAVPFLKLEDKWVDSSKKQYYEMIKEADAFLEIDKISSSFAVWIFSA